MFISAAALVLVTLLAFSNSFTAGFTLDNKGLLLEDQRIRELTPENVDLILHHTYWWPRGEAGLYRPFTTFSYLFNYAILGNADKPAGYHWINILLHLCNVLLVYALARKLVREFWPAFFMSALWAVHPVLTESVTNMIGRSDLLAGMAILGGLLLYLKSTETSGWRRIGWLAALMILTAVGVFSKESAVVIVGVIALYEFTWWKERKHGWGLIIGCLTTLAPIAAMLYQRAAVLSASPPAEFPFADNPIAAADFWTGRFTAIKLISRYAALTVWPATLSADYSYAQIPLAQGTFSDWAVVLAVAVLTALAVSLYWWNRTAFFLMWFAALTFLPTSNLLLPIGAIMAERFLYLSTVGIVGCVVIFAYSPPQLRRGGATGSGLARRARSASAIARSINSGAGQLNDLIDQHHPSLGAASALPCSAEEGSKFRHVAPVVLSLLLIAFGVRTWIRNQDWQDQRSMVEANLRTSPLSFKVHNIAASLYAEGPDSNLDRAIQESEKSLAILDSLPDRLNTPGVYSNAGGYYLAKGDSLQGTDPHGSVSAYERALQLLLRSVEIDKSTRAEYDRKGGAEWARRHSVAPASSKGDPDAHWLLVAAYQKLGKTAEAANAAGEAVLLHPLNAEAYQQIATAFAAVNRMDDAAFALFEGLLMTSNVSLRSDLVRLYQGSDSSSCAIIQGPAGPSLNIACDQVRKSLCPATVEVIKAAVERSLEDAARKLKQTSLHDYGCPAEPLQQVLPD